MKVFLCYHIKFHQKKVPKGRNQSTEKSVTGRASVHKMGNFNVRNCARHTEMATLIIDQKTICNLALPSGLGVCLAIKYVLSTSDVLVTVPRKYLACY